MNGLPKGNTKASSHTNGEQSSCLCSLTLQRAGQCFSSSKTNFIRILGCHGVRICLVQPINQPTCSGQAEIFRNTSVLKACIKKHASITKGSVSGFQQTWQSWLRVFKESSGESWKCLVSSSISWAVFIEEGRKLNRAKDVEYKHNYVFSTCASDRSEGAADYSDHEADLCHLNPRT